MNNLWLSSDLKKTVGLLVVGWILFACNAPDNPETTPQESTPREKKEENNNSARILLSEAEQEEEIRSRVSRSGCSNRDESSRKFSIKDDSDNFISSNNIAKYELSGRCEIRDLVVQITVNGYPIDKNPSCDKNRWKVEMDLSAIAQSEDRIVFKVNHNGKEICKELKVAFSCPKNYIPVPALEDYFESSFCAMKYEAKVENEGTSKAKAVSRPKGKPYTRAEYRDAIKLCENNGPGYSLMENSQWQNIALSIEDNLENWSTKRKYISDNNMLNCGVSSGLREASDNDLDDCYGTSCNPTWDFKRRTHFLSNGQVIWDMCGNAPEMMKDRYTLGQSFTGHVYELTSKLKDSFGPARDYEFSEERSRRSRSWGLGYADIEADKTMIIRGYSRRNAGLFSVRVNQNQGDRGGGRGTGFRCVYIP